MPKYYIYLHKRIDNDEIFYVGRGKIYSNEASIKYIKSKIPYRRAYAKDNRNKKWHEVIKETKYIVIILFDNLEFKEACNLETELINFHGRKDLNLGTLTNRTDGGEEDLNRVYKPKKKIRAYDNNGNLLRVFNSMKETALHYKMDINSITRHCKNPKVFARKTVRFRYDSEKLDMIEKLEWAVHKDTKINKEVGKYDLNMNFIKRYNSINEASKETNLSYTRIWKCCNHKEGRTKYHGFIWEYMEKKE